jgi:hypothetical protein
MFFSDVQWLPHNRTAQEKEFQKVVGSPWIHPYNELKWCFLLGLAIFIIVGGITCTQMNPPQDDIARKKRVHTVAEVLNTRFARFFHIVQCFDG